LSTRVNIPHLSGVESRLVSYISYMKARVRLANGFVGYRAFAPVLIGIAVLLISFRPADNSARSLIGGWQCESGNQRMTRIFTEKYFTIAVYNKADGDFVSTAGGSWRIEGTNLVQLYEYNTANPNLVGTEERFPLEAGDDQFALKSGREKEMWKRLDDGTPGQLAGAWLITGRYENGEVRRRTPGVRRTMKILSGTRFQWIAYNTETKEFFGTGGGTYTTENGKYTEHIEFFSRDKSRVGASLEFEFIIQDGEWRHKGRSSRGEPLDEVWTRREVLGI